HLLHRALVALALPVADGLLPRLELPRARDRVVVAELRAERVPQNVVRLERAQRALQRARERRQILARGGVALDRSGRGGAALDAVGGGGGKRGERQVRVGVGAGAAALDAAALRPVGADHADRGGA